MSLHAEDYYETVIFIKLGIRNRAKFCSEEKNGKYQLKSPLLTISLRSLFVETSLHM